MSTTAREVRLAARPQGEPVPTDFELATVDVPDPAEGEVLVRNLFMSVDPYMRGRMNDVKSYVPPFQVGAPLDGGAVGEVVASTVDSHAVGDLVLHGQGWRELAVGPAKAFSRLSATNHPSAHLGVLGMPGLTAWAGLFTIAGYQPGETVFVSGAAGAVGSLVGQLVTATGGTAIGSAGSPEKVAWLRQLGFAQAFSYKDGPVAPQLREAAPDGIDVYFDNVGGEHLEAAIASLKPHGRAALCGMISQYNNSAPKPGPANLALCVGKRLRLQGFIVSDHADQRPAFEREMAAMLADGRVVAAETVVDGLENAPGAFIGLLRGENTGKMVVRL
ncbi:MAG: NADP-dependent oxidoreductase [Frankiales bacterium]|jgi:NADPH-dependent curcumin reductase CurA|nr:NADP-dependent oxidoreductase [Frankiales bacterium]